MLLSENLLLVFFFSAQASLATRLERFDKYFGQCLLIALKTTYCFLMAMFYLHKTLCQCYAGGNQIQNSNY